MGTWVERNCHVLSQAAESIEILYLGRGGGENENISWSHFYKKIDFNKMQVFTHFRLLSLNLTYFSAYPIPTYPY